MELPCTCCKKDKCKRKHVEENAYCKAHQLLAFVDETKALGKRVCKQHIRGCRVQLDPDYKRSACEECLKKEREKDKLRRANARNADNTGDTRTCTTCCKEKNIDQFIGVKNDLVKSCTACRE